MHKYAEWVQISREEGTYGRLWQVKRYGLTVWRQVKRAKKCENGRFSRENTFRLTRDGGMYGWIDSDSSLKTCRVLLSYIYMFPLGLKRYRVLLVRENSMYITIL